MTKADRADPGPASAAARELLGDVEAVAVATPTGEGLDALRAALERAAARCRLARGPSTRAGAAACRPRVHHPRRRHGRDRHPVVGHPAHGGPGARWRPRIGSSACAGCRCTTKPVDEAPAGQRVAVNLTGVALDEVARGDVLADPDAPLAGGLPARLRARSGRRARRAHAGSRSTTGPGRPPARLSWLGGRFWQVRCERPLLALAGDRLVVRRIASPDTLGGGRVLDAAPGAARPEPGGDRAPERAGPRRDAAAPPPPMPAGPSRRRRTTGRRARRRGDRARGTAAPGGASSRRSDSELDAELLGALREAGRAVRVTRGLHMHPSAIARAREQLVAAARTGGGQITLAQARDVLVTSRKFAQALLEHLDAERVFVRRGDAHVLRRGAQAG